MAPRMSQRDREILNIVTQRQQLSADSSQDRRSQWRDNFDSYLATRDDPAYPWESNLVMPAIYDAVETFLPHVVAEDIQLRAVAREGADPNKADVLDGLLLYDSDQIDLGYKMVPFVKQALIYSCSPFFLGWQKDEKLMRVREFATLLKGTPLEVTIPLPAREKNVVTYDGPFLQIPDVFSVFPEPGKTAVNGPGGTGMNWLIWVYTLPIKAVKMLNDRGVLKRGAFSKLQDTGMPVSKEEQLHMESRAQRLGVDISERDRTTEHVEIMAMWGDRGEDEEMPGLVWIGNRQVVLRDEPHPFHHGQIPFGYMQDVPLPHDIFGLGEADILRQYQEEKSDLRNSRLDNVHLTVARMWSRIRGSGIDPSQLIAQPGGVVDVNSHEDIRQIQVGDVPISTYQDEELLQADIERTAGQLDILRGARLGGDRSSATENQLLAEFAAARTRIKLMSLKRALRQIGRWMIQLEQQFTTKERTIRINGPTGFQDISLSPEDISGQWDVIPVIDQKLPMTKAQRRQQAQELYNLLAPLFGDVVLPDPVVEELLRSYGHEDVSKFLVSAQQARAQSADPRQMAQEAIREAEATDTSVPPLAGEEVAS